jgi:hypothetical protein
MPRGSESPPGHSSRATSGQEAPSVRSTSDIGNIPSPPALTLLHRSGLAAAYVLGAGRAVRRQPKDLAEAVPQ